MGNEHPSISPYEAFAVADGSMVVAVGNDRQFGKLSAAVGMPELASDERFARNTDRVSNRVVLRRALAAAFATRTGRDWFDGLAEAGVPCGPINDIAAAFSLADELGLRPVVDADGSRQVAHPIRFSRTPPHYRLAPPTLGEHTDDVLYGQGHG